MSACLSDLGYAEDPLGGYFFRGGLLGIVPGRASKERGRKRKDFYGLIGNMAVSE